MQFKDVVGQQATKANLIQGAQKGRISHAQLFCGSEGVGALAMALAYAQYLNCEQPGPEDSCGQCGSCHKYQGLVHPDLHFSYPVVGANELSTNFIEEWRKALLENPYLSYNQWIQRIAVENKQGNITAAETHQIVRKLSLKMYEGPYKVLIMWMPELLGKDGNVLLKLIEEPGEHTLLLFVTEDRDKILATIQSRTQIVQFSALLENEISEGLQSKYGLMPERATTIARIADGNFNAAIELLEETDNNMHDVFRQWMLMCYRNQMGSVMGVIEEMSGMGRTQLKNLLSYGLYVFRAGILYQQGVYDQLIPNHADRDFVSKFSQFLHQDNIHGFVKEFNDAIFHIERNANPKITLLNLSLQLERLFRVKVQA